MPGLSQFFGGGGMLNWLLSGILLECIPIRNYFEKKLKFSDFFFKLIILDTPILFVKVENGITFKVLTGALVSPIYN